MSLDFNNNSSSDRQVIRNRYPRGKLQIAMELLYITQNSSKIRITSLQHPYYIPIIPKKKIKYIITVIVWSLSKPTVPGSNTETGFPEMQRFYLKLM